MRQIDADALIDAIKKYASEPVKLNDRRWNTKCTAIIMDMISTVKMQSTIDAIPVEWLRKWPKDLREGAYVRDILRDWQEKEAR